MPFTLWFFIEWSHAVHPLLFSGNKRYCTTQLATGFSCILNPEERDLKILSTPSRTESTINLRIKPPLLLKPLSIVVVPAWYYGLSGGRSRRDRSIADRYQSMWLDFPSNLVRNPRFDDWNICSRASFVQTYSYIETLTEKSFCIRFDVNRLITSCCMISRRFIAFYLLKF